MSFKVTMQECQITHDNPVVRTRVPMEQLQDGVMIAQAVRAMRLSPGDRVLVQSMNHERTELLHEAMFVVVKAVTSMKKVTKDDMSEQSVEQTDYVVTRKGEWWDAAAAAFIADAPKEDPQAETAKPGRKAKAA